MTIKQQILSFLNKHEIKKQPPKEETKPEPEKESLGIREQELEFEESRHMLQTDLFPHTEAAESYFPQFDHLLKPLPQRPKSITQSIRRRLSFHGKLKKAISTPDFSKKKQYPL
ncbi:hypothetical protein BY458DRAFT_488551 [Sporodiniella umbellata]|nr:hypothetical protein BY458DRAFT_488551 [Sporodiniella umbellata]